MCLGCRCKEAIMKIVNTYRIQVRIANRSARGRGRGLWLAPTIRYPQGEIAYHIGETTKTPFTQPGFSSFLTFNSRIICMTFWLLSRISVLLTEFARNLIGRAPLSIKSRYRSPETCRPTSQQRRNNRKIGVSDMRGQIMSRYSVLKLVKWCSIPLQLVVSNYT